MRKPLPPVFANQRARLAEHDKFYAEAKREHPGKPICPDCYHPPESCPHWRPKR